MKKIALLATVALATAAVASTTAAPVTGYYAGVNVGLANTNVKYSYGDGNTYGTQSKLGDKGLQYGLFGGYNAGLGNGCVVGLEVFVGGDNAKVVSSNNQDRLEVKHTTNYGVAPRIGYMITPSVLAYVRLGVEGGAWKAQYRPGGVAAVNASVQAKSKRTISFAPGVGFDMLTGKNVFVRAQYHHVFGPKISITQTVTGADATITQTFKTSQSVVSLGVGYKF